MMLFNIKTKHISLLLSFIVLLSTNYVNCFQISIRDEIRDWRNISSGDQLIVDSGKMYELACSAEQPVEWATTGVLESYRMENNLEKVYEVYKNTLVVRFTERATGTYSCNPANQNISQKLEENSFSIFVNGNQTFLEKGGTINLNEIAGAQKLIIPCRTANSAVPTLTKNSSEDIKAIYNDKFGFQLKETLKPGDSYKCCLDKACIKYDIVGKSFAVTPQKNTLYLLAGSSLVLKCQGSSALNMTSSTNENLNVKYSLLKNTFEGGPTKEGSFEELNVQKEMNITCHDSSAQHTWRVFPDKIAGNSSIEFLAHRNAFLCRNPDVNLALRNLFCESKNNCDLKYRCFKENTCTDSIEEAVPCDSPGCVGIRDPYTTGIIECSTGEFIETRYYYTGLNGRKYYLDEPIADTRAVVQIEEFPVTFYKGLSPHLIIYCRYNLFTLYRGAFFQVKFANGTMRGLGQTETLASTEEELIESESRLLRDVEVISIKFEPTKDMTEILCVVPKQGHQEEYVTDSREIRVVDAEKATIWNTEEERILYTNDVVPVHIICNVTGQPSPTVHWRKRETTNNDDDTALDTTVSTGSILTFNYIDDSIAGTYYCHTENKLGKDIKTINIMVRSRTCEPKDI